MLSEITRGALDPEGWQPLIDARPDWFEVIHLYGIKSGWERLKQLSLTRIPLHDTSTLLTGSPPRLATSMPTGSPGAPRGKDCGSSTRHLLLDATIHVHAAPARSSSAATGRRTRCTELLQSEDPLCYPLSQLGRFDTPAPSILSALQFFDHTPASGLL